MKLLTIITRCFNKQRHWFSVLPFRFKRKLVESRSISLKVFNGQSILTRAEFNSKILEMIENKRPVLVSRFGTTESAFCLAFKSHTLNFTDSNLSNEIENLWKLSGVFPKNELELSNFFHRYTASAAATDLFGVRRSSLEYSFWQQEKLMHRYFSPKSKVFDIEELTPALEERVWLSALNGKRVLIVHPFETSILSQLSIFETHSHRPPWLPDSDFIIVRAPQSLSGSPTQWPSDNWTNLLDDLISRVRLESFDVALLGCGAYGLPLGAAIKEMGKPVIHIGGSLQLLFAIRGARWENDVLRGDSSAQFPHWNWPDPSDTPLNSHEIEGGAYWLPPRE